MNPLRRDSPIRTEERHATSSNTPPLVASFPRVRGGIHADCDTRIGIEGLSSVWLKWNRDITNVTWA